MKIGLELLEKHAKELRGMRLGVICNQASVDSELCHISERVLDKKLKLNVTCFLGPQHGIRGEKQDDMKESQDSMDPRSGLTVYSLYGKFREPSKECLDQIDAFVVDLQEIGSRVYTFCYTLANCMRAAKQTGKKVFILDRPNPVGGLQLEGNVLDPSFSSFVGQFPIIVRHGMTLGELAELFNDAFGIGCDLRVFPMQGWKRTMMADQWKRAWVVPSPNIPNGTAALVFSGMVHFEGTLISEGRGTTKPFEYVGAPFIDADRLATLMNQKRLPGVYFRPVFFQPTYQKCAGEVCGGVQIHVTDAGKFKSFETGLSLLQEIYDVYPEDFRWKPPPYEYELKKLPIDVISGTDQLRKHIENSTAMTKFLQKVKGDVTAFKKLRKDYLKY